MCVLAPLTTSLKVQRVPASWLQGICGPFPCTCVHTRACTQAQLPEAVVGSAVPVLWNLVIHMVYRRGN